MSYEADGGAIASISSSMRELKADEAAIEKVQKALHNTLNLLNSDPFTYMATIQPDSFGTDQAATTLSFHHGLAHQVMNDTLQGIKKDIEAFATNLAKAHDIIKSTDADAGTDLRKRQDLVTDFNHQHRHENETAAHNHARNHQHNPWDQPPGTNGSATGGNGGTEAG